jgi:hypothetical protein
VPEFRSTAVNERKSDQYKADTHFFCSSVLILLLFDFYRVLFLGFSRNYISWPHQICYLFLHAGASVFPFSASFSRLMHFLVYLADKYCFFGWLLYASPERSGGTSCFAN